MNYKALFKVYEQHSLKEVAYRNRWGHWVWISEGSFKDPFTLGTKAPKVNSEPRIINNEWYWVLTDD